MGGWRNKDYPENISQTVDEPETGETSAVEKLAVQAVNGNTDAFGKLYTLFAEKIYRYIFYHINSKTATEDITGEVFIKAWGAIKSCKGREKSFSSWLYRIAHNQLVDEIRKRQRRSSLELEDIESIRDPKNSVEECLEQQELLRVIDRLPSNQGRVIILKFIECLDNGEIALIMGKREGTIRALQMRALAKLKKELNTG
jgi:RNA polymerase sigma-70 factor (ECF subfamily)